MTKLKTATQWVLVAALMAMIVAFGLGTIDTMPDYAPVYLDDLTHTYLALPCLEEWQHRQSHQPAMLRLARANEAFLLSYAADDTCRNSGAFAEDGRSAAGLLFVRLGILPPARHWWNMPYRNEEGAVVQPH
jgi:hypothetical protein